MFKASRGCVYCVRTGNSRGMFAIQGLAAGGCPPIIITAITPQDADIVAPATTLNRQKRLAVFGEAISPVSASGIALLGLNGQADTMRQVTQFFRSRRVSRNRGTVNMSFPGGAVTAAITSFSPGTPDAEYNIMPFNIGGYILNGV